MPKSVEGYGPQLQRAADYVRDCRELYRNAVQTRNALIVEAVDNGCSGKRAARETGMTQPAIIRILSCSQPDSGA